MNMYINPPKTNKHVPTGQTCGGKKIPFPVIKLAVCVTDKALYGWCDVVVLMAAHL